MREECHSRPALSSQSVSDSMQDDRSIKDLSGCNLLVVVQLDRETFSFDCFDWFAKAAQL